MTTSNGTDRERRAEALYYANRPGQERREWSQLRPVERDEYRRQAQREGFSDEVSDGSSDQTNAAAYVGTAMRGRMDDIRALVGIAETNDLSRVSDLSNAQIEALGIDVTDNAGEWCEEAEERLAEFPLCVEATTTFEVVLGTGGPDDRLCFECDRVDLAAVHGQTVPFADRWAYEIRRVLYRYSWSGSGEVELYGEDREAAEAFARRVVPELVE